MSDRWTQVEQVLRDKAYARLDHDPQILLETDGGPVGMEAELIYARLIGFEDEIVRDGLQLNTVMPRILLPITRSPFAMNDDPTRPTRTRTAVYELQSGYVLTSVAAEYLPPDVPLGPNFTARVLYLRYRRRS